MSPAPVSVVIPTIGRPDLLRNTLASISDCSPAPAEILVVDQSDELSSVAVIEALGLSRATTVACEGRGRGRGVNAGLRRASQPIVLITDDDCTVTPDWVGVAADAMAEAPLGIITGQVLPAGGDPRLVPSILEMAEPREYTGEVRQDVLYGGNMACSPAAVLELGGFDELIRPAAEDCELCYRWLRSGARLRHVPELVVHHHDWRSPEELGVHYIGYYRGQGMFYAKYLLGGDLTMLRFIGAECADYARSIAFFLLRRTPRWLDVSRGVFPGLPLGLRDGWRTFRKPRRGRSRTANRPS